MGCFRQRIEAYQRAFSSTSLRYLVENVIKQLVHVSAVLHQELNHLASFEGTQDARVALQLLHIFRALKTLPML